MRVVHTAVFFGAVLVFFACGLHAVQAQLDEAIYRIEGIEVAETADNSVTARADAIANGQRQGLIRLLERLTAPADRDRLPSFDEVPVDRYVQSFDVLDEQVSGTSYEADLNVVYLREPVQGLLRGLGIPFAIRRSEPVLIIPARRDAQQLELWRDPDQWNQAWYQIAEAPGLMTLVLPLGDLEDVSTLTSANLAAGRTEGAPALASRYGAESVVLVIAVEPPRSPEPEQSTPAPEAADGAVDDDTAPDDASPDDAADVVEESGPPMPDRLLVQAVSLDAEPSTLFTQTLRLDELGEDGDIYQAAAALIVQALEDDWKASNIVRLDVVESLAVDVPLSSLQDWVSIRRGLEETPEIRAIRVNTLSREEAQLSLDYVGTEERLRESLERRGQVLVADAGGFVLRPLGQIQGGAETTAPLIGPGPTTPLIEPFEDETAPPAITTLPEAGNPG
ncbi:MAG: DUF2066 domain-containing protein [Pseudomonadota bacterium]